MSESYFITLEQDLDEIDIMPSGKALAKMMDRIDDITDEIGVTRMSDFVAAGENEDFSEIAEQEGWDLGGFAPSRGGADWFEAADGLDTVRAVAGYIESDPDSIKRARALLDELKEFEKVLELAQAHHVRFRLEADY
ncbi:MAG: hypothetical protein AB7E72_02740 [Lysobacterales bacterium]